MARQARRTRPTVEGLEDRQLMAHSLRGPDGKPISAQDYARLQVQYKNAQNGSYWFDRKFAFRTPEGGRGLIVLYGLGTLRGTTSNPATGALDIVYNNTSSASKIVGFVRGGTGLAKVHSLRDADVPPGSNSGVSSNQINVVNLHSFDLVPGGQINLVGGVADLFLHSAGANSLITVQSLPIQSGQTNPSPTSPTLGVQFVGTPGGGLALAGIGGLAVPGAGTSTAAATSGTPTSGFTTRLNPDGTVSLIPVTGTTTTTKQPAYGVNLVIDRVQGTPHPVPLANPQIFGYDPTATATTPFGALIRFDASTGANLGTIPLQPPTNDVFPAGTIGEVGLARDQGRLVGFVGVHNTVEAFDTVTGAYLGQFNTANILGGSPIDGVGEAERGTLVLSSSAANQAQIVDVAASLAAGQAVPPISNSLPVGPFTPTREFVLTGGATGAAGLNTVFFAGRAFFDPFQPNRQLPGILTANSIADRLVETSRSALPAAASPAVGSVDIFVAIDSYDAATGTNLMSLYNPNGFTPVGAVTLQDPNRITGLSESFHPELEGSVVINAIGTVNQFTARDVTGLACATIGYLNLAQAHSVTDSAFVSLPIGHIDFGVRKNVMIYSSSDRSVSSRNGVTLVPTLRAVGPLTLPGPSPG